MPLKPNAMVTGKAETADKRAVNVALPAASAILLRSRDNVISSGLSSSRMMVVTSAWIGTYQAEVADQIRRSDARIELVDDQGNRVGAVRRPPTEDENQVRKVSGR